MPMLYERYGEQVVHAIAAIPLDRARICCRCECVHDTSFSTCPKCGSGTTTTLADWLGHINEGDKR